MGDYKLGENKLMVAVFYKIPIENQGWSLLLFLYILGMFTFIECKKGLPRDSWKVIASTFLRLLFN